jgi:16S rRNA (uracil1498-N3)-methyltransferase
MVRDWQGTRSAVPERFYAEEPVVGSEVWLRGAEAHHLLHVMRARAGSEVLVFDGSGYEYRCVVREAGRSEARLEVVEQRMVHREPPLELHVAAALPKGERQAWLVEKLSELGAARLIPIETVHGVVVPGPQTVARLRRIAVQAAKQCGRTRLLEIAAPQTWQAVAASLPSGAMGMISHLAGGRPAASLLVGGRLPPQIHVAVGPEGGWSETELTLAVEAGWQVVGLGERVLRVETAAVALAALVVLLAEGTTILPSAPQ